LFFIEFKAGLDGSRFTWIYSVFTCLTCTHRLYMLRW